MSGAIHITMTYPHPPERVWAALTDSEALEAWLMPNDFQPVVGHKFTVKTDPAPGFDGIVHCEVLELEPPSRLSYTWRNGVLDTTVSFRLEPVDGGTRLTLEQTGFTGVVGRSVGWMLGQGWRRKVLRGLQDTLDRLDTGAPVKPVERVEKRERRSLRMWLSMQFTGRIIRIFGKKRNATEVVAPDLDR